MVYWKHWCVNLSLYINKLHFLRETPLAGLLVFFKKKNNCFDKTNKKPPKFHILFFYTLPFYLYFFEKKQMFLPEINFSDANFLAIINL